MLTKTLSYKTNKRIENLNEPNTILILLKCNYCVIKNNNLKELWLIECQNCTVNGVNTTGGIRLTQYPPFYKLFNKRRQRKWIEKNGTIDNIVTLCTNINQTHNLDVDDNGKCTYIIN